MKDFISAINRLIEEVKELKNLILGLMTLLQNLMKQTRTRLFKEEWVDGQDIQASLHISARTLKTLRDSRQLPFTQICGKYFYRYSDLRELLNKKYSTKLPIKKS